MEGPRSGGPAYSDEPSFIVTLAKYWGHGFLYQLFNTFALIPILLALVLLTLVISIIGLIIGLVLMFLVIGWINKMLSGFIWKIECRGAVTSLIGHGLAVFLALLLISFPMLFLGIFTGYNLILYYVIQYALIPLVQGYIAKAVAKYFEDSMPTTAFPTQRGGTAGGAMTTCPYCNAVFPYREIDITPEGTAPCRTCGAIIQDPRHQRGGPRRSEPTGGVDPRPSRDDEDSVWG